MSHIRRDIVRFGITAVYTHPDAKVNIVLVHGLNGAPEKTWTATNGTYWPIDLLPTTLYEKVGLHANILVYGYNADVYSTKNDRTTSSSFILHHAQSLVYDLTVYRRDEGWSRFPIIWVCHSLGGILTKRALEYSNDVHVGDQEELRSIYVSTYAIIFLATPHDGSDLAPWGHMIQAMADAVVPKKLFESESVLLKTLKRDNETLQNINLHFLDIYQRFKIQMVHENHKTDLKATKALVVDAKSASPQLPGVTFYGVEATHSGICKFDGPDAPGYRNVSSGLAEYVRDSPGIIQVRWTVEEDDRRARAALDLTEKLRPYLNKSTDSTQLQQIMQRLPERRPSEPIVEELPPSPLPLLTHATQTDLTTHSTQQQRKEPLFVHPETFRPNSFFVGRKAELRDLHDMLQDPQRRSEGSSAVLIQCLPGGGKTHLARQYVFQHRDDYPGGIYWVRAKSLPELEAWYWQIAKHEALRDLVNERSPDELRDPAKVFDLVRGWFNSFDDWLLVFDGILFDVPGVERFVPDRANTSIIFTSTQRAVTGDHHFDNPQLMELSLLTPKEAQDLLLTEMEKKKPWTPDDQSRALDLVQLMGRLPVMIHVTAQNLKATREPLARYLKSYKARPKVSGLTAYTFVWTQLQARGATAAMNLMSMLVWFDQHIPLGMLTVGLTILDKTTPYKTRDAAVHGKPSLSNTLKVLISFAMVERTEEREVSPTSSKSSQRNSLDLSVEALDILKVHSVIQGFVQELLIEDKQHYFWIERAATVFCRSFDESDRRIRADARVGLPDDYRRFAVHGRRIHNHIKKYEKRSPVLLGAARMEVEERLEQIDTAIQELSESIQAIIVNHSGEVPQASVFERTSSASETDSSTPTDPSTSQQEPWIHQYDDDAGELVQSPTINQNRLSLDEFNPHHFHINVPYPAQEMIPAQPFLDDDDTLTATPHRTPRLGPVSPDTPTDPYNRPASELHIPRKPLDPHFANVQRGRDWRDQSVSDPKLSISRETARVPVVHTPGGQVVEANDYLSAGSEAEKALNRIRHSSPATGWRTPSPSGRGRSQTVGTGSPSNVAVPKARADTVGGSGASPQGLASGLAKVSSAASSATTATFKFLRSSLLPARSRSTESSPRTSNLAVSRDAGHSAEDQGSSDGSHIGSPASGGMFQGTRTTQSSPAQQSGRFERPGPRPVTGLAATTGNVPSLPHWNTHAGFHPGLDRIDSSNLGANGEEDLMAMSYPSARHVGARNPALNLDAGSPVFAESPVQAGDDLDSSPFMLGPRLHADLQPGSTRAELGSTYPPSSLAPRGRPRAGSANSGTPPSASLRGRGRLRPSFGGAALAGAASGSSRTQSLSSGQHHHDRPLSRQSPLGQSPADWRRSGSLPPADAILAGTIGGDAVGSQPMSRNSSGGIKLSDGRVIEFGNIPDSHGGQISPSLRGRIGVGAATGSLPSSRGTSIASVKRASDQGVGLGLDGV